MISFYCWLGWAKINDLFCVWNCGSLDHPSAYDVMIQLLFKGHIAYQWFINCFLVLITIRWFISLVNQCYLKDYGAISAIPLNEYYSLILDLSLQHGIYVPNIDNFGYSKSSKL